MGMSELHTEETLVNIPTTDELALRDNQINKVYTERNKLVALVMKFCLELGLEAGVSRDPGLSGDDPWGNIVYFEVPSGQCSFHIHDSEMGYFAGLPHYRKAWDGHTTTEKFQRILSPHLEKLYMRSWTVNSTPGLLTSTFSTLAMSEVQVEQELHSLDKMIIFASEDTEGEHIYDEE